MGKDNCGQIVETLRVEFFKVQLEDGQCICRYADQLWNCMCPSTKLTNRVVVDETECHVRVKETKDSSIVHGE